MGFDVKRFIDNVNNQFICGICEGVLEDPLMIKQCQHFYCAKCIRNRMKTSAVCPKDHNLLSFSQLIEPQLLILNLLNDLKIKCEFTTKGCEEVVTVGQLDRHRRICEKNPLNKILVKCFCGQELAKKELTEHKKNCLESIKNEIHINRSQIATFMADIYSECAQKAPGKRFRCESEYLYHRLSQSLPQRSRNQNSIQNIMLYLNWRLLDYRQGSEEHNRIKSGLKDLYRATFSNNEAIRTFLRLNGLDYILFIRDKTKSRDIDLHITDFLLNFCQFEVYLKKLLERPILEMLLSLINPKTCGIENSFNCVDILSQMIVICAHNWNDLSSTKERKDICGALKTAINGWKLNVKIRRYDTLDNQIAKLKTHLNAMPTEVLYRYVWILVHHTRANPEKYVPMVEAKNIKQLLEPLLEEKKTEPYIQDFIRLLFHQISTFKTLGHLNGLENTDKREFLIN